MDKSLLITSVGSLVGQNILDSLEGRRAGLAVVGLNSVAASPNIYRCDRAYLAPAACQSAAYRTRLMQVLRAEQPRLVLPGRDDDVLLLAALREQAPEWAHAIPCGPPAMARLLGDKLLSGSFAAAHGLPFADTASGDLAAIRALAMRHGFPLIAKPRAGNGSRGVRIVYDEAELAAASRIDGYLFQEYLSPGDEVMQLGRERGAGVPLFHAPGYAQYACQCLITPAGRVVSMICTEVVLVAGRAERSVVVDDADVGATAGAYAEALARSGWRGSLNLQGRRDRAGRFKVYELNGRLTGGTAARLCHGVDEVGLLCEHYAGVTLPPSPRLGDAGQVVMKSLVEFPVQRSDVATMEQSRQWTSGRRES